METIDTRIERLMAVHNHQEDWFKSCDAGKKYGQIFRLQQQPSFACATEGHLFLSIEIGETSAAQYPEVKVPGEIAKVLLADRHGTHELITAVEVLRDWAEPIDREDCVLCDGQGGWDCDCDADDLCFKCDSDGWVKCTSCDPIACRPGVVGGVVVDRGLLVLMLTGAPDGSLRMERAKVANHSTPLKGITNEYSLRFVADGWKAVLMPMRTDIGGLPPFSGKIRERRKETTDGK